MNKDKETALAKKLNLFSAIGFYLAATGLSIAAIIGRNLTFCTLGVTFLCVGTLFLVLSLQKKKDGDSKK